MIDGPHLSTDLNDLFDLYNVSQGLLYKVMIKKHNCKIKNLPLIKNFILFNQRIFCIELGIYQSTFTLLEDHKTTFKINIFRL